MIAGNISVILNYTPKGDHGLIFLIRISLVTESKFLAQIEPSYSYRTTEVLTRAILLIKKQRNKYKYIVLIAEVLNESS